MTLPLPPGQTPRRWQLEALSAARHGFRHHNALIVSAATGTGKGSLIAGLALLTAQRGGRVLILAHRKELVLEIPSRIRKVDPRSSVGVVMAGTCEIGAQIVVASVQSLTAAKRKHLGRFDLVMTDECHHATAPMYQRVYEAVELHNPDYKHLGLTATPFRSGSNGTTKGLGKVFEGCIYQYGIADAIAAGDLVPIESKRVETDLSLDGVKTSRTTGDYKTQDLANIVDCPERNALVVDKYLELCPGEPALVFSASIEHAQHLAEAFAAKGVKAAAVWGDMPDADRDDLIRLYRERPDILPVLCSKDLIFEGFDAPATRAVLKARPTKSLVVFTQMVGRGLRLYPGKSACTFIDFVDNGCDLTLETTIDLSDERAEKRDSRSWATGDRCQRRHHEDWGVGTVVQTEGEGLSAIVSVFWPVSKAHPEAAELNHPPLDLKRVTVESPVAEEVAVEPQVDGVRTYDIILLPGADQAKRKRMVGWYEYQNALVAGGDLASGSRLMVYVEGSKDRWEVWTIKSPSREERGRVPDHVARKGRYADRNDALEAGEDLFRKHRARVSDPQAQWRGQPATEAQVGALEKWRIRRDLSDISRGEASALLDAVIARRKVSEVRRRLAS